VEKTIGDKISPKLIELVNTIVSKLTASSEKMDIAAIISEVFKSGSLFGSKSSSIE
jgi:hypothetical protein